MDKRDNLHILMFLHTPDWAMWLLKPLKFFNMKRTAKWLITKYVDVDKVQ